MERVIESRLLEDEWSVRKYDDEFICGIDTYATILIHTMTNEYVVRYDWIDAEIYDIMFLDDNRKEVRVIRDNHPELYDRLEAVALEWGLGDVDALSELTIHKGGGMIMKMTKDKDYEDYLKCPKCGKGLPFLNVNRNHWFYCDDCKVKVYGGSNLFSCWRHELMRDDCEELWENNRVFLEDYETIEDE